MLFTSLEQKDHPKSPWPLLRTNPEAVVPSPRTEAKLGEVSPSENVHVFTAKDLLPLVFSQRYAGYLKA